MLEHAKQLILQEPKHDFCLFHQLSLVKYHFVQSWGREESLLLWFLQLFCFCSDSSTRMLSHMAMTILPTVPTHFLFSQWPYEMSMRSLNLSLFVLFCFLLGKFFFCLWLIVTSHKERYLFSRFITSDLPIKTK